MREIEIATPVIAVTGPDRGGWPAWTATRIAVWRAGGRAIRITPSRERDLRGVDGLIIGGGADVDPTLYQEKLLPAIREEKKRTRKRLSEFILYVFVWLLRRLFSLSPGSGGGDPKRDEMELKLIREALAKATPVFGICRGAQLLNVHFGGSLYQDLSNFYVEVPQLSSVLPKKLVQIEPDSHLADITGSHIAKVNSLHRQAVRRLGQGLIVSAHETTGVVQAIEHRDYPFVIGVQWHPEYLPFQSEQQALFQRLMACARHHSNRPNIIPLARYIGRR